MLTAKTAERIARDLPTMSADELSIAVGMMRDWAEGIADAPDPKVARDNVQRLFTDISDELDRRKSARANGT